MIISLGSDCSVSNEMQIHNYRQCSLPFDWITTRGGISKLVSTKFEFFLPNVTHNSGDYFNSLTNVIFSHDQFPEDNEKYTRRINRFYNILESTPSIIFVRKSHMTHYHGDPIVLDDSEDMNSVAEWLEMNYPKLKFIILLMKMCSVCCYNEHLHKNIRCVNMENRTEQQDIGQDICKIADEFGIEREN
jgi:hypothetical protein